MTPREQIRTGIVLASASPRRKQLLVEAGVTFDIMESGVIEEKRSDENASTFAQRMAGEKALAVSARVAGALVLGADTVVEIDGEILGKPGDIGDARAMLEKLSGRTHHVITAFAFAKDRRVIESVAVTSRVTFRRLEPGEIESYIRGSEPYDKAGAYAVQGAAGGFISRIDGSRTNVMGLPIEETLAALKRHCES